MSATGGVVASFVDRFCVDRHLRKETQELDSINRGDEADKLLVNKGEKLAPSSSPFSPRLLASLLRLFLPCRLRTSQEALPPCTPLLRVHSPSLPADLVSKSRPASGQNSRTPRTRRRYASTGP